MNGYGSAARVYHVLVAALLGPPLLAALQLLPCNSFSP